LSARCRCEAQSSAWSLAYQSRSGRPTDPWLEPDISQTIRNLAAQGEKQIVVAPIGFVCDHVKYFTISISKRGKSPPISASR
jgi:ferrochelatase